jgi:PRTRC genetic system protein B
MNRLTQNISAEFNATQAIIIYRWDVDYYLETHAIKDGKMMEGKALTKESISNMVEHFHNGMKKQAHIKGVVPPSVLYCNYSHDRKLLVWYKQPEQRQMYFTDKLSIPNGKAWQPGLIYVVDGCALDVYVYKGTDRPKEDTLLYRAPYHNVSDQGNVCIGSARVKKPTVITYQGIIDYWETIFWNSEFSHLAGATTPINGNVNLMWKALIEKGARFDEAVLVESTKPKTFAELIKSIER